MSPININESGREVIKTSYYTRLRRKNRFRRFIRKKGNVKKIVLSTIAMVMAIVIGGVFAQKMLLKSESIPFRDKNEISERSMPIPTQEDETEEIVRNSSEESYFSDSNFDDAEQEIDSTDTEQKKDDHEKGVDSGIAHDSYSESIVSSNPVLVPEYSGEDYVDLNNGIPMFTEYDIKNIKGEKFSDFDELGRCGVAVAMIDRTMMPTEERGGIGMIRPSGWHTVKYPEIIGDLYLYNRCHLIGYALTGQNANELNLITGTRYFNVSIMLIFENETARVLEDTGYHVLYRVTPYFKDDELVARGVEMEAYSVEDEGESLCFHVFCYNIQPGVGIDYLTGDSWVIEEY